MRNDFAQGHDEVGFGLRPTTIAGRGRTVQRRNAKVGVGVEKVDCYRSTDQHVPNPLNTQYYANDNVCFNPNCTHAHNTLNELDEIAEIHDIYDDLGISRT